MKLVFLLLTVIGASAHANLSYMQCNVIQLDGRIISFLPPVVGDRLTLDLSGNLISDLTFASRNMIPVQNPLQRKTGLPKSILSFSAVQVDDSVETDALTLVANAEGSGIYDVEVQQVVTDKMTGLLTQANLLMSCVEAVHTTGR